MLVPCRFDIEAFDDLRIEAEELWRAERNADSVAGIGASWGCVGAQFADSRGELVAQWSEHFRHSASPVTPVDDDGLLQIDWPTPAAGSHPLAVDLILATATQAQSKRPTIADIANAWATQAHDYERYFIENIRAGIHTTEDEAIWASLMERRPVWLNSELIREIQSRLDAYQRTTGAFSTSDPDRHV